MLTITSILLGAIISTFVTALIGLIIAAILGFLLAWILRNSKIGYWRSLFEDKSTEYDSLHGNYKLLETERDDYSFKFNDKTKLYDRLKIDFDDKSTAYDGLLSQKNKLDSDLGIANTKISETETKLSGIQSDLAKANNTVEDYSRKNHDLNGEIERLKKLLEEKETGLADWKSKFEVSSKAEADLNAQLNNLKSDNEGLQTRLASLDTEIGGLKSSITDWEGKYNDQSTNLKTKLEYISDLEAKLSQADANVKRMGDQLTEKESSYTSLFNTNNTLKTDFDNLLVKKDETDVELQKLTNQMSNVNQENFKLKEAISEWEEKYRVKNEDCKKHTQLNETHLNEIERLKNQMTNHESMMILKTDEIGDLKNSLVLKDKEITEWIGKKDNSDQKLSKQEIELSNLNQQQYKLKEEIAELKGLLSREKENNAEQKSAFAQLEKDLAGKSNELASCKSDGDAAQNKMARLNDELVAVKNQMKADEAAKEKAEKEAADNAKLADKLSADLEKLKKDQEDLLSKAKDDKALISKLNNDVKAAGNKAADTKDLDALQKNYDAALKEIEKLKGSLSDQKSKTKKAESEVDVLKRIKAKASLIDFNRIGKGDAKKKDNLQEISGIGPFIEKKLNALGIYQYKQIANFDADDIEKVNDAIEFFPGRVKRDDWVGQAKILCGMTDSDEAKAAKKNILDRVKAKGANINFTKIGKGDAKKKDDLKRINGVGPFSEEKLNTLGIYQFKQIANFDADDIEMVNDAIEFFPGRIERDNWVPQAKALADGIPESKEEATLRRIKEKAAKINFDKIGREDGSKKDDLKRIKGIGPFIEKKLNALGIYTFKQISNFDDDDADMVNDAIEFFPGRAKRDDWKGQAKDFVKKG